MAEDVSTFIKLAITVCLCASLVATVSNISATSLRLMEEYRAAYASSAEFASSSTISSMQRFSSVESSNIYKLAMNSKDISKITVILLDGTTKVFDFGDPNMRLSWFKENAIKRFRVEAVIRYGYELTCTEVDINER